MLLPRTQQMLRLILEHQDGISDQELAEQMNLSKRTVQRELKDLEYYLSGRHLTLTRIKGAGLVLNGNTEEISALRDQLLASRAIDYTDKQERRKALLFELLKDRGPHKLYYFSDLMQVSEATISHDLEKIEPWLAENHLTIIRKPGFGVALNGSEKDYREALQRFISVTIDEEHLKSIAYQQSDAFAKAIQESTDGGSIYQLLSGEVIQRVSHLFADLHSQRLSQLAESAYLGLIIHISIAVQRIMHGGVLEEPGRQTAADDGEDSVLTQEIISRLEREFAIRIPGEEFDYILLHLRGSKLKFNEAAEPQEGYAVTDEQILNLIDRMIDAFDPALSYELKCDEVFIHGLLIHLQPTLFRIQHDMSIFNPLLREIQEEYADIYSKCQNVAAELEAFTGKKVNDAEIGYLATHFGAAVVRMNNRRTYTRKVRIGVVCASGFGVARLMMTKLANHLNSSATMRAYAIEEITAKTVGNVDFFVTSMNMDAYGVDYILVSPLITAKNLEQIKCKIEEYAHVPRKDADTDFFRQLNSVTAVSQTIRSLLRRYQMWQVRAGISFDEMLSTISVRAASGSGMDQVLKRDLQAREDVVSQIIPEMGFGLLHCRTDAVSEPACYNVLPLDSESFTDPYFRNIRTILVLLMPKQGADAAMLSEMLGKISAAVVEDPDFVREMAQPDEEAVRAKLALILKAYFNEYISVMDYGGNHI